MGGNMQVNSETLSAHGAGSRSLADKFGQLAQLLEQARTDDQCFGPIGNAVGISDKYFESLQAAQEMVGKAKEFLTGVKQALDETAKDHDENDRQIGEALAKIGKELGG
ncbi:hypothetical protein HUO13_31885 [Saccharopolyspora erythraea]|uniref:hypothetical protein n=1 Tax=Saccharopolyspora erythraea TaxID=1836 RepID=UPI001BAA9FA1|nr:hypothetical protein [Saccharopolyspora erythraea]QUH04766.1 hypothetical protein HUO13_31885 [Saccharopolyspora erythraea]